MKIGKLIKSVKPDYTEYRLFGSDSFKNPIKLFKFSFNYMFSRFPDSKMFFSVEQLQVLLVITRR